MSRLSQHPPTYQPPWVPNCRSACSLCVPFKTFPRETKSSLSVHPHPRSSETRWAGWHRRLRPRIQTRWPCQGLLRMLRCSPSPSAVPGSDPAGRSSLSPPGHLCWGILQADRKRDVIANGRQLNKMLCGELSCKNKSNKRFFSSSHNAHNVHTHRKVIGCTFLLDDLKRKLMKTDVPPPPVISRKCDQISKVHPYSSDINLHTHAVTNASLSPFTADAVK